MNTRTSGETADHVIKPPSVVPPALRSMLFDAIRDGLPTSFSETELVDRIHRRVLDVVDEHLRSRDVGMLAALQTITFHSGSLAKRIRERLGQTGGE